MLRSTCALPYMNENVQFTLLTNEKELHHQLEIDITISILVWLEVSAGSFRHAALQLHCFEKPLRVYITVKRQLYFHIVSVQAYILECCNR